MKLNYDSVPTFLLFAAGLFVMFASPPVVNYEGVESAGKNMPFDGEENEAYGKAYVLESDDYVDKALALTEAYSNLDKETFNSLVHERMLPFADQMDDQESYSWKPWAMVPLRRVDDDGAFVVSWSYDESVQDNGSKAATHYIDILRFDDADEGKLSGMWSTLRQDPENSEYGLPEGGKFVGRNPENEYSGRPFVFSNRGETSILEKLVEDYNKMDVEGFKSAFAEEFTLNTYDGKTMKLKKSDLGNLFKPYRSVDWSPIAIVPIKIRNTDAASGVMVYSSEKRVFKNGRKWEKDLMEIFYFDLEGKISSMVQFAR